MFFHFELIFLWSSLKLLCCIIKLVVATILLLIVTITSRFFQFQTECILLECNYHSDCSPSDACFNHKCVDPCSLSNVCGHGADCSPLNHSAVCTCQPGGTGDPNLGCTPVQYCKSDSQCATGSACNGGICTGE